MSVDILKYIAVNFLLLSSWYLLLFNARKTISFSDRLIGTFILSLAQIIATEMLLGIIFQSLFATPLFLLNVSISLPVIFIAFGKNRTDSLIKETLKELKSSTGGVVTAVRSDIILSLLFGLMLAKTAWLIFIGYLFPSYTWDALWYHLPIVGYIMQGGAITENPANFMIDTFINIFPKNMELIFLWNVIFLKSDTITNLSQLPFVFAGMITTYSIAIKLKIKQKHALYSSCLFFFTPIIILQATTNYIDVAVAVLLLITINFLLYENPWFADRPLYSSKETGRGATILLAGIAGGILLGSKGSGPLFVIVLSAAIMLQEFIKHHQHIYSTPPALKDRIIKQSVSPYILYFFLPLAILGTYWYIKNWTLYGNPVYPMEIAVFGKVIFKGLYKGMIDPAPALIESSSPLTGLFHVWTERVEYYLYDSRMSGLGPIWLILLLPSLLFTFINSVKNRRHSWLFIILLLILAFILHPRNWNTRYVIFIISLGALSYGFVLDYFGKKGRLLNIIALLLAGYTFVTANSPCVMPVKIGKFLDLPSKERTIAHLAPFNIDLNARQEYGHWIWVNSNISEGETISYTFEPLFLSPLWNRSFSNRVKYISEDNYNDWMNALKSNNTTYVLLRKFSREDEWIENERKVLSGIGGWFGKPKEKFKTVYTDENYKIMKLLGAKG